METQTMSIHRALSELKLIDAKIIKNINAIEPVGYLQKDKLVNRIIAKDAFEKDVTSRYQSITDMIRRKVVIKSAIINANAKTTITINNKTMTVAEAIHFKQIVELQKILCDKLIAKRNHILSTIERRNIDVEHNALDLAKQMLSKDNVKVGDSDVMAVTKPYIEANEYILVDPLTISDKIDELETNVSNFLTEIDATLSEVNATTIILI